MPLASRICLSKVKNTFKYPAGLELEWGAAICCVVWWWSDDTPWNPGPPRTLGSCHRASWWCRVQIQALLRKIQWMWELMSQIRADSWKWEMLPCAFVTVNLLFTQSVNSLEQELCVWLFISRGLRTAWACCNTGIYNNRAFWGCVTL